MIRTNRPVNLRLPVGLEARIWWRTVFAWVRLGAVRLGLEGDTTECLCGDGNSDEVAASNCYAECYPAFSAYGDRGPIIKTRLPSGWVVYAYPLDVNS